MKICPVCNKTYDDFQNYCLDDGKVLNPVSSHSTSTETVIKQMPSSVVTEPFKVASPNAVPTQSNSAALLWVLLIVGGLILLCGGGSLVFFSLIPKLNDNKVNNNASNTARNINNAPIIAANNKKLPNLNTNINLSGDANAETNDAVNTNTEPGNTADGETQTDSPNSALTMAKYNQIKAGMSYESVAALLGNGKQTSSFSGGGVTSAGYEWKEDKKTITLRIENGKVMTKSQSGLATKTDPTVTLEKFNQLKEGMSYKEVTAVMGSDGIETSSYFYTLNQVNYEWYPAKFSYMKVTFQNGKLTRKTQSGLK